MRISVNDEKRGLVLNGVRNYLQGILAKITKVPEERLQTSRPFTAYGVDSIMRATINQQISKDFPGISKTLLFEYETLDEIADYLYRHQEENCQKLLLLPLEGVPTYNSSTIPVVENIASSKALPLSIMQSQLYSFSLADPHSAEYNMGVALKFRGSYHSNLFKQALKLILNRHDALRMRIDTKGNRPQIIVSPQVEIDLPIFSLDEKLTPTIRQQQLDALIEKYKNQPINLSQSPLMHTALVQLSKEEHVLIAVFHHMIMDGWSLFVFTKDLHTLLRESHMPAAYQYSTHLLQESLERDEEKIASLNFWKKQFSSNPDVLQLPTNAPRSGKTHIEEIRLTASAELTAHLQKLAQQEHVTLFNCLLSAYQVLLSHYSGASDIVVGVPYLGRDNFDTRDGLGLFIHTIPLRANFIDNQTFIELMKSNHVLIEAARKHQSFSLSALLRELKIERIPHTPPLFQVLFNLIQFADQNVVPNPSEPEVIWAESGRPAYDLNLEIIVEKQLKLTLKYDAGLFSENTVTRIMQHFLQLLQEISKQPHTPVSYLSLLTNGEKHQLLIQWNQTKRNYSENKTLHQLFVEQVERTPEDVAISYGDQKMTYKELNLRANQVAHFLQHLGVLPDDVVAICMERSLDLVIGLLAILKAGGAYLPLDSDYPSERLQFMLRDSQSKILMTHATWQHLFLGYSGHILNMDEMDEALSEQPHFDPISLTTPDHLIYVIYTSGSTGVPKGVENKHRSLVNRIEWMQHEYQLTSHDKVLQKTPMSFDVSVWEFFWPLLYGSQLVIAPPQIHKDVLELTKIIQHQGITVLHFVPSVLSVFLLVDYAFVHTLRMVFVSGEALPVELAKKFLTRFQSTQLHNLYGPTEAAIDVSYWHCKEVSHLSSIPIGRPIANTQLYILNQNMQPVPIGVFGELYIGGVGVARGYRNRPDLTNEKFLKNPFATENEKLKQQNLVIYRTGDAARYLPDGNIEYVGRLDQQVKLRGLRIELEEIEHHLRLILTRNHAAVILYEDEKKHKQLVAYILSEEKGKQLEQVNIKQLLMQSLAEHMIPEHIIEIDQWPLSPNGKTDKKQLVAIAQNKLARGSLPALPLKQQDIRTQTIIAEMQEIVGEILASAVAEIDPTINFGDLGFDSIRFSELTLKINKKYGIHIPPQVFYRYKNLEQLTQHFIQAYPEGAKKTHERPASQGKEELAGVSHFHVEKNSSESCDVAIIGIAGRLPQSPNIDIFWQNLINGKDMITEIPDDRWDWKAYADQPGVRWGGFISDVDKFDAAFFNISPLEADAMDPQQRLLLESVWHTLEDAGYQLSDVSNTRTGVFIGTTGNEYVFMQQEAGLESGIHSVSGIVQSIAANRISYFFNLKGPCAPIDTACSSSLVAVHRAVNAINSKECEMAIVSGVNLLLSPSFGYPTFSKMGMLSPDGKCKAFDASANGYVRAEGVITLLLKPLARALIDHDRIHAVIKGSAENHGGKTHGLTVPNPVAQSEVIVRAHQKAAIDPTTITYIEAHGTGTSLGDPIEIDGLQQAFGLSCKIYGKSINEASPCGIGSVKTHVGHLEGAAGIAGLLKGTLALSHKTLPANLHFKVPNPAIDLTNSPFYFMSETRPWTQLVDSFHHPIPRRAGISSFGFGGSNAHVILEEAPQQEPVIVNDQSHYVLTFSARQVESLMQKITDFIVWLADNKAIPLQHIAYTLNVKRTHFKFRKAFVVKSADELLHELTKAKSHNEASNIGKGYDSAFRGMIKSIIEEISKKQPLANAEFEEKLKLLADLYQQGFDIDWKELYPRGEVVSLPLYPFSKTRYWFKKEHQITSLNYFSPVWQGQSLKETVELTGSINSLCVFTNDTHLVNALTQHLTDTLIVHIRNGDRYQILHDNVYYIRMNEKSDYEQLFADLRKAAIPISHMIVSMPDDFQLENLLQQHLFLIQTIIQQKISAPCLLSVYLNENVLMNSALVGFAKCVKQEYPDFAIKIVGLDKDDRLAKYVCQELHAPKDSTFHVRYTNCARQIEQFEDIQQETMMNNDVPLRKGGVYLITGGLGKLGFQVASYLAKNYQAKLLLTGRSLLNSDIQSKLRILDAMGAETHYLAGDISKEATALKLVSHALQSWKALHGVFHCAGIIQDQLLIKKTWPSFKTVFETKVKGAIHLDKVLDNHPLDCFVLFSALVGYLGNVGQCDYAGANAYLNEFAIQRMDLRPGKSIAIGWPYWLEGGMQIEASHLQRQIDAGLSPLTHKEGMKALEYALKQNKPNLLIFYGNRSKILANEAIYPKHSTCCNFGNVDVKQKIAWELRVIMAETIKMDPNQILDSEYFSEYGFDSILFAIAADKINRQYAFKITPALFFTYLTLDQLVEYLLTAYPVQLNSDVQHSQGITEKKKTQVDISMDDIAAISAKKIHEPQNGVEEGSLRKGSPERGNASLGKEDLAGIADDIAVIGMSCKIPGAPNAATFWNNLLKNQTNIQPLPRKRKQWWQSLSSYNEKMIDESYCWGGFISQVETFDADFFKILPREAELLDPQQRILLEETWHCFEDAGYKPSELAGKNIGVFVGAQLIDYEDYFKEIFDPKIVTGTARTMLANRVSYHFDFTGPSETIDTSCASSSIAIQKAIQTIRLGECEVAVAAGISLLLSPKSFLGTKTLGILGQNGKCQSFARGGNGMIKGEGIGVLLLKKLKQAIQDGDNIHGIIKGVAVNHNGHSHTITSPNALRQAEVIQAALKQAKVSPEDIHYIETQATGSEMGDMVEFEAYKHVWQKASADSSCYLGNLKANIGHLESASGVISIIKVLLALKERMIPSSSPVLEINPHIVLEETPFKFNHDPISWKSNTTRYAGVHNYGFGGVNAHFILAEHPRTGGGYSSHKMKKYIFVLSANNKERLQRYAKNLYRYLHVNPTLHLASLAFTLQIGREEMEERVAFPAEDMESLMRQLKKFYRTGQTNRMSSNKLEEIADHWSHGGNVDWKLLYEYPLPSRISIPTYPFAKNSFWVKEKTTINSTQNAENGLYRPLVENSHLDLLRLSQIDPPRHPSRLGKGFLFRMRDAQFGFASQSPNGNFQPEAGIQDLIRQQIAEFAGLKSEEIDLKDSLFEQGIDSILLSQLFNKLSEIFEIDIGERIAHILEFPSIENIARQLKTTNNFSEDRNETRVVAL